MARTPWAVPELRPGSRAPARQAEIAAESPARRHGPSPQRTRIRNLADAIAMVVDPRLVRGDALESDGLHGAVLLPCCRCPGGSLSLLAAFAPLSSFTLSSVPPERRPPMPRRGRGPAHGRAAARTSRPAACREGRRVRRARPRRRECGARDRRDSARSLHRAIRPDRCGVRNRAVSRRARARGPRVTRSSLKSPYSETMTWAATPARAQRRARRWAARSPSESLSRAMTRRATPPGGAKAAGLPKRTARPWMRPSALRGAATSALAGKRGSSQVRCTPWMAPSSPVTAATSAGKRRREEPSR